MAKIAIYTVAAIFGILLFGAIGTFVLGEMWPTMPYERALPAILVFAAVGCALTVASTRALLSKRRNAG